MLFTLRQAQGERFYCTGIWNSYLAKISGINKGILIQIKYFLTDVEGE